MTTIGDGMQADVDLTKAKAKFWTSCQFAVVMGTLLGLAAGVEALIRW